LGKKLRRGGVIAYLAKQPICTIAMEACAGSHFWGREIGKFGFEVRLIPPAYVKPFVKRQKNDAAEVLSQSFPAISLYMNSAGIVKLLTLA